MLAFTTPAPPLKLERGNLQKAYEAMSVARAPALEMARDCAMLTLPRLLPPEGYSGQRLPVPYQGIGARGVNNLSSKLLTTLFTPNSPFFAVEPSQAAELALEQADPSAPAEVREALMSYSREFVALFESMGFRPDLIQGIKLALVGGLSLIAVDKENNMTIHGLDRFVVNTNRSTGKIQRLIIEERYNLSSFPPNVQDQIKQKRSGTVDTDEPVALYTGVEKRGKSYEVWQEAESIVLETEEYRSGNYPEDKLPYYLMSVQAPVHTDYPPGHVEELLGYLQSLEGLSQAIVEASAAMSRGLVMVNPNGTTRKDEVAEAGNWAVIDGTEEDVKSFQIEMAPNLQVAAETARGLETNLSFAFLMNTAIQRDAERVTAEEIRVMIQELDDSLGGLYSAFSERFQRPFIIFLAKRFEEQGLLAPLPTGKNLRYRFLTGLEALGRGHEFQRLTTIWSTVGKVSPEALQYFNLREMLSRLVISGGVDPERLIYSEAQVQQMKQQAAQLKMMETLGPNAVNALGGMAQTQMQQQSAPQ